MPLHNQLVALSPNTLYCNSLLFLQLVLSTQGMFAKIEGRVFSFLFFFFKLEKEQNISWLSSVLCSHGHFNQLHIKPLDMLSAK